MSRRRRRKRHGFLKFILALLVIGFIFAGVGAWLYVRYYPGGSVESLKSHAKQAQQQNCDGDHRRLDEFSFQRPDHDVSSSV